MKGIRLQGKKASSLLSWSLKRIRRPSLVRVPLCQFPARTARPCVSAGDTVLTGQKIAEPESTLDVALHASISGKVTAVDIFPHPVLGTCPAVEIKSDDKETVLPGTGTERAGWESLDREEMLGVFRESGLVGLGGDGVPLHWKVGDTQPGSIHTLILNACESEPYVTSDHSLMMTQPLDILKGAEMLRQLYGAEKLLITVQKDKLEVAELLKSKIYFLKWEHCEVRILPVQYPQGHAIPLIHTLFRIDLASRIQQLHASFPDTETALLVEKAVHASGLAIEHPATAFAVYEAVALQKPFYERAVTVGGECVIEPRNFMLPVGTSFAEAIKAAKGLMREPGKVLMGGPMQGLEQADTEVPVIAVTSAVLALPKEVVRIGRVESCIRSGHCVEACPVEISPVMITLAAEHDLFWEAESWGLNSCINCGNCTYVCPSKRPMAELIQYARRGARTLKSSPKSF